MQGLLGRCGGVGVRSDASQRKMSEGCAPILHWTYIKVRRHVRRAAHPAEDQIQLINVMAIRPVQSIIYMRFL